MFTGLVEEAGRVEALEEGPMLRLVIYAEEVLAGTRPGDSIAVNGVCLTVSEVADGALAFFAMPETLRRTALGGLREGGFVNLERALAAGDRMGGHVVQGHVDGVGEVLEIRPEGDAEIWTFAAPESVLRYTVEKGSACVDGISLTVAAVDDRSFAVSILPQTKEKTNLKALRVGDEVNLEADVMGKYVEKMLGPWIAKAAGMAKTERSRSDAV